MGVVPGKKNFEYNIVSIICEQGFVHMTACFFVGPDTEAEDDGPNNASVPRVTARLVHPPGLGIYEGGPFS